MSRIHTIPFAKRVKLNSCSLKKKNIPFPEVNKQHRLRLTVHDVTLKQQNLRNRHREHNNVKQLRGARFLGDFPLVISQVDLGHTLSETDSSTCSKSKVMFTLADFPIGINGERRAAYWIHSGE